MTPVSSVIPSITDDGTNTCIYLDHPAEKMSGYLADIASNPTSNVTLLPPSPPTLDGEWAIAQPPVTPSLIRYHQVDVEVPPFGSAYPSLPSASPAIHRAAGTPHPESFITNTHEKDLPVTSPSDSESMCQTTFSWFPQSISLKPTLRGSEGSWPTSVTSNEDTRNNLFAGADTNWTWHQEGVSVNAPLNQGHQHTRDITTSIPSTLPGFYRTSTVVQYQEQMASREILPQQSQISGKGPTTVPPNSPDEKRGLPEGQYLCSICDQPFKQQQGVTRHHRDVHEVSLCMYCHDFEWHRRHQLKEHLQKQHPDVNLSVALCEVTRSRRKATVIEKRQRQQRASPEMGVYPSLPPPAVVVEVNPVSPTTVSSIGYEPKPESSKSTKKRKREDSARELLNSVFAHIAFPPLKESEKIGKTDRELSARRVKHVKICVQNTKMLAFEGRYTAPTHPLAPRPAPISSSTQPVDGYNDSQPLVLPKPLLPSTRGRPHGAAAHVQSEILNHIAQDITRELAPHE